MPPRKRTSTTLLPIGWQYSLVPLGTELVEVVRTGGMLARLLAGLAVFATVTLPWDADYSRNGEGVVVGLVLAGLAFLVNHARPPAPMLARDLAIGR